MKRNLGQFLTFLLVAGFLAGLFPRGAVFGREAAFSPDEVILVSPSDGATVDDVRATFVWFQDLEGTDSFTLQYSRGDDTFSAPTEVITPLKAHTPTYLAPGTYYWRVKGIAGGVESEWSSVGQFTVSETGADGYNVTERASVSPSSVETMVLADLPQVNADGRYVIFVSADTYLVAGDSNSQTDVFWKDMVTGEIQIVSSSASGTLGNGESTYGDISADGTLVVFSSIASNLAGGDSNGYSAIFLKNITTGALRLVSTDASGTAGNLRSYHPRITPDGSMVVFDSTSTNLVAEASGVYANVYLKSIDTGEIWLVSSDASGIIGDSESKNPDVSADGRYVAFESASTNLVSGDINSLRDVFVKDMETGAVELISVSTDGTQSNGSSSLPSISADGRYVVFMSHSDNLIAEDTNNEYDIFLRDRETGTTTCISMGEDGLIGNDYSQGGSISDDGRYVTFYSNADLVSEDNTHLDVYVYNTQDKTLFLASVDSNDQIGNGYSRYPAISGDGRVVVYRTSSTNLAPGDTNGVDDIYVRTFAELPSEAPTLLSPENGAETLDKTPDFDWTDVTGAVSYMLQYDTDEGFSSAVEETVTESTFTPTGDLAEGVYYWRVKASDGVRESEWSSVWSFTVLHELSAPTLTAPADDAVIFDAKPTFSWGDVVDATGYTLQYSSDEAFTSPTEETITEATFTAASDLAQGEWFWRVKAGGNSAASVWSSVWSFQIGAVSQPTYPKNNHEITAGTSILKWTEAAGALHYDLTLYRPDGEQFDALTGIPGDCTAGLCSYKLPYKLDIEYGSWQWRVKGVYAGDAGVWSEAAVFDYIQLSPISVQTPADNAVLDAARPTFTWEASAQGVFAYNLEVWAVDGTLAIEKNFKPVDVCGVDTCSWTATEDLVDGVYTWRVRAKKWPNNADWSQSESFTIQAGGGGSSWTGLEAGTAFSAPQPRFPKNEYVITVGTSLIKWTLVNGANSYVLELYRPSGGWFDAWEIDNSACDETLCQFKLPYTLGTEFGIWSWRVRAKDGDSVGSWGSSATFNYVQVDLVSVIAPVDGAEVGSTTPTFTWEDSSQNLFKYVIEIWTADGTLVVTQALDPGDTCSDGTCSWTSTTSLTAGEEYKWRVLGKKWPNTTGCTEMELFTIAD